MSALSLFIAALLGFQSPEPATVPTDADPAAKPQIVEGEVTGRDVYVRSGPSLNHYETCKLQLGDRVSIVGEKGDWLEIVPPAHAFSLISGEYVDTTDQKTGMVNGENVRVRAGSELNANKYTVQTLLTRGSTVEILGTNPDGFVRIKPPKGATLWVNRTYIKALGPGLSEPVAAATTDPPGASTADGSTKPETAATTPTDGPANDGPAMAAKPSDGPSRPDVPRPAPGSKKVELTARPAELPAMGSPHRKALEALDEVARGELAKPASQREWAPLIEKFRAIAAAAEDEVSRVYATYRVEQLSDLLEVSRAVRELKSLDEMANTERQDFMARRLMMEKVIGPNAPATIDAQGELRASALYPPGSFPRRYRLLDMTAPTPRTIGYVEIPDDVQLDADSFIGRYVGIRAREKRLQTGGVNPVPVFVASEIVPLQRPGDADKPQS